MHSNPTRDQRVVSPLPPSTMPTTTTTTTMISTSSAPKSKKKPSTALSKARDRLRGVTREDSDDELGYEDIPWEWIHSTDPKQRDDDGVPRIVGARMGTFDVQIGDCILIKGEGLKGEAYVGMACEFEEGEDEMLCNVMWFSTESEIRPGAKKRLDSLPVCILPTMIFSPR
jgi:origin recognition complex subunit 1